MEHFNNAEYLDAAQILSKMVKSLKLGPRSNKGRLALCFANTATYEQAVSLAMEAYSEAPQEPSSYEAIAICAVASNRWAAGKRWILLAELAYETPSSSLKELKSTTLFYLESRTLRRN